MIITVIECVLYDIMVVYIECEYVVPVDGIGLTRLITILYVDIIIILIDGLFVNCIRSC